MVWEIGYNLTGPPRASTSSSLKWDHRGHLAQWLCVYSTWWALIRACFSPLPFLATGSFHSEMNVPSHFSCPRISVAGAPGQQPSSYPPPPPRSPPPPPATVHPQQTLWSWAAPSCLGSAFPALRDIGEQWGSAGVSG